MNEYRSKGITVTMMLHLLGIPESTYYRKRSLVHLKRERKTARTTCLSVGNHMVRIPDTQIINVIEALMGRGFVCYGCKKVTKYLQKSGYHINKRNVLRIMRENNLLNHTYNYHSPAKRVVESVAKVHAPNKILEMDIKYIYIQGENRTTYFFAMIDCFTREVVGKYMGYHCTSDDMKKAMTFAFMDRGMERISHVRIGSENGTQFMSRTVELFLTSSNINHERTHSATPKENAHIESFNFILEKEVIRRFELSSFENAEYTMSRFIDSIKMRNAFSNRL